MQVHRAGYGISADEKSDGVFGVSLYTRDCYVVGSTGWVSGLGFQGTICCIYDSGYFCRAVKIGAI